MKRKTVLFLIIILSFNTPLIYSATDEGYGEANENLGQFTDTFENEDYVMVSENVDRNSTYKCMELEYAGEFVYLMWEPIQLREHESTASGNPDYSFTKPSDDHFQIYSTLSSMGTGYAFFTVKASWINDKYIRVYWRDQSSWGTIQCWLLDGDYDRSSLVDFPSDSGMIYKGNGLLQTIRTLAVGVSETFDVQIDASEASLENCTIMFRVGDSWSGQSKNLDIFWIEINDDSGGSDNIVKWDITASETLTMEQTSTKMDYGRVHGGSIQDYSFGGYESEGYFITEDYLNYTTGKCLSLLTNASISEGVILKVQFSLDNSTWVDNKGNTGSTLIVDGFYAIDLRNLNYNDVYIMYNFTGTVTSTPRLYQSRLITTEGIGNGNGEIVYKFPSQSLVMLIFLCVIGSIVLLGVRKR